MSGSAYSFPYAIRSFVFGLSVCAASMFLATPCLAIDAQAAYANGDYKAALQQWKSQADMGDVVAMFSLSDMYLLGNGVPEDHAEAARWYRKAAEHGYAKAQSYLAAMYRNGDGVAQDKSAALRWYRKAAEQNFPAALNALGDMYLNGVGVPKDENEAKKWYKRFDDAL